ncbi:hypothetical protein BDN71DRAFT_1547215 [Pleurotus eryngii]|uniref:F-box domain-containing protein n=1 Tax=Pleurotus eryngii TaxID=5323 RepID=A0A9P6D8K4_PLEER|nr:hypothetical protein BDN71DRAFT_1547215 [Pleurotus eryngii]
MLKFDYPYSATDIVLSSLIVGIILGLHTQRSTWMLRLSVSSTKKLLLTKQPFSRKPHIGILPFSEEKHWLAVAVVCRRWREIALASVLLWSSIIISQPRRALTLLERSKSAPLQASSGSCFILSKRGEIVAKKVMCAVERIQTLHVEAQTGQDVFKLLLLNRSPKLEEIDVTCLVKDETPELPRIRAKLPNLLRLSIEADDLETRAILANLKHPRSTSVSFFHFIRPVGEPDLSTFVGLCDHFSGSEVITIDQVKIMSSAAGDTREALFRRAITTSRLHRSMFGILLGLAATDRPYVNVRRHLQGSQAPHRLQYQHNKPAPGSRERVRGPPPLLRTIMISECRFTKGHHLSDSFLALKNFLKQRKHLGIPITKVTIMFCCITESAIRDLEDEDSATINWDDVEVYSGTEMMCYDDGIDNDIYPSDESDDV